MAAVCSFCGHEFSNVQVSSTVQNFFEKYDAIIQDAYEKNSAKEGDWAGALGATFADALRGGGGVSAGVKRQIGLIESYPIPNTKGDILEFALLASSRYKGVKEPGLFTRGMTGGNEKLEAFKLDEAWKAKCEQAYTKARISFGSDKDAIAEIENILKKKKII
jgi:hypothetical protein